MLDAPLALAFAAGMVATVNPCGFALLPAYLSYFLGADDSDRSVRAGVARSLAVGGSVALGFLVVFSVAGLALSHLQLSILRWAPWLTMVVGVGLVLLGLAMLRGFQLSLGLPKLARGGRDRTGRSMFLFGASYAVASLSCTLPVFLAVVAGTFRRESLAASMTSFVAYAAGMAIVLLALTVSMGLARHSLLRTARQAVPYVSRAAGAVLVLVGAYVAYFGWYENRVLAGDMRRSAVVDVVTGWSGAVSGWVYDVGPVRLGGLLALVLLAAMGLALGARSRRPAEPVSPSAQLPSDVPKPAAVGSRAQFTAIHGTGKASTPR